MKSRRIVILGSVVGLFCVVFLWNLISGWGLVTVHVRNVPLAKVIASIERQSGAKLLTNADAATPVSMDVDRVTTAVAVNVLSNRIEGNWRLVYVLASSRAAITPAVAALKAGERRPKDWKTFSSRGRQDFPGGPGDFVPDPREIQWNISDMTDKKIQAFLDQFSQKTGVSSLIPEGWNPEVPGTPKNGKARATIPALAKSVGGSAEEFFFITKSNRGQDGERMAGGPPPDSAGGRPDRPETNPEWAKERLEAQIAQLPAGEQDAARKEQEQMQKTFQELRGLPADQRQAKLEQIMNDPAVQDRIAAAQDRRDSGRSPDQRANRYRNYVARKQASQAAVKP